VRESSEIMAVKKDIKGEITHFLMSNGQVYDFPTVLRMAETGQLKNVEVVNENGRKTLHNFPGQQGKQLSDLPLFD